MKKILIFGNGISMKYAPEEYSPESIKYKFIEGIKCSFDKKLVGANSYKNINNDLIKLIDSKNFDEGVFFEIFKYLFIYYLENKDNSWKSSFPHNYKADDLWSGLYKTCIEDKQELVIRPSIATAIFIAQSFMEYSLGRALMINKNWNGWIEIKYENLFIEFLSKNYSHIYTTNYYVDNLFNLLNSKENLNCKHLHGEIKKINNFKWINDKESAWFKNENNRGYEISSANILFGKNYNDKFFLHSLKEWQKTQEGNKINFEIIPEYDNSVFENKTIDIIGLSTQGDKHIIKVIGEKAREINVYCYTMKDYEEWREEVKNFINKVKFHCSHTYEGFDDKTPNNDCPELCKF